jgi:hypothetical protein
MILSYRGVNTMAKDFSAWSVEVALVPVALRLSEAGASAGKWVDEDWRPNEDAFLMLTHIDATEAESAGGPKISYLSEPHDPELSPRAQAERMSNDLQGHYPSSALFPWSDPREVGFSLAQDESKKIILVFTVAAPVSVIEVEPPPDMAWTDVHRPGRKRSPHSVGIRNLVREFWRQQLEETTAAQLLLPRFFTMRQLMDAYSAVWNLRTLDWGNFKRWATDSNTGMLHLVPPETVKKETRKSVQAGLPPSQVASGSPRKQPDDIEELLASGTGISPAILAVPVALLSAGLLGAVIGTAGAVAYQGSRRGKPPAWYEWTQPGKQLNLAELFGPRPAWHKPNL